MITLDGLVSFAMLLGGAITWFGMREAAGCVRTHAAWYRRMIDFYA